jgi:beta-glucanase (GH16 family)
MPSERTEPRIGVLPHASRSRSPRAQRRHAARLAALAVLCAARIARAGGWTVAFEDTFDGAHLDRQKWATRYVYEDGTLDRLNDEWERYRDDDNHEVHDGALSLIARVERHPAHFASGMIRSRQTFYYGYFEARVWLPNGRGAWPAFWLNSDYDGDGRLSWPPEIDAFEYVLNGQTETPDMLHSAVAVGKTGAQDGQWLFRDDAFSQHWSFFRADGPLNAAWQVIGLLWKPDSVTMYLNGRKLYTRAYRWVYNDGARAGPAHVLLNLAVGGRWAGASGVDEAQFPQELKIDYVRVCQYRVGAAGPDRCAGSPFAPTANEGAYETDADDLARPTLRSAVIGPSLVKAGEKITALYRIDAVATAHEHEVQTLLLDASGKILARASNPPPTPTSTWHGSVQVEQTVTVPPDAAAGPCSVRFAVGSPKTGGAAYQYIPIAADPSFGVPDGQLRYKVGQVSIAGGASR